MIARRCSRASTATRRSSRTCRGPKDGDCRPWRRCTRARGSWRARRRRACATIARSCIVDPLDVDAIAARARAAPARCDDDAVAATRRRASVADLTWRNCRARPPGGLAMRVALDVSAVPERIAGRRTLRRRAGATPARARGVDTTLVTRRDDATGGRRWSPAPDVAPLVPGARVARLVYEAWRLGTSEPAREASTCGTAALHDAPSGFDPDGGDDPRPHVLHESASGTSDRRSRSSAARSPTRPTHAQVLISVSEFTARQTRRARARPRARSSSRRTASTSSGSRPTHSTTSAARASTACRRTSRTSSSSGPSSRARGSTSCSRPSSELARDDPTLELWIAGQPGWGWRNSTTSSAAPPACVAHSPARLRRRGGAARRLLREARVRGLSVEGGGFRSAGPRGDGLRRVGGDHARTR